MFTVPLNIPSTPSFGGCGWRLKGACLVGDFAHPPDDLGALLPLQRSSLCQDGQHSNRKLDHVRGATGIYDPRFVRLWAYSRLKLWRSQRLDQSRFLISLSQCRHKRTHTGRPFASGGALRSHPTGMLQGALAVSPSSRAEVPRGSVVRLGHGTMPGL